MQSSSRNGARVRVFVLHTTEGIMRAAQLRDWTGWAGSSHAAADETGALLSGAGDGFVDYSRASWTLRSGNPWSDNLEMCGWAHWTRAEWLARPKLLEAAARWLAERHKARPWIPLRRIAAAELRAGQAGVIDHDTYTKAYRDGTHWDVGTGFPWDVVLARAQQIANGTPTQEDDMTPEQAGQLRSIHDLLGAHLAPSIGRQEERQLQFQQQTQAEIVALRATVAALTDNADITPAEIEAAVAKALRENVVTVDVDVAPGARTTA